MDWSEIFIPITLFSVIGYIVYIIVTNRRLIQVTKMQADVHGKLLDKFGSSQELVQYLESDAGRAFLEPPSLAPASPYRRILGSVQAGIILSVVGGTFMIMHDAVGGNGAIVLGGLLLALGVGFLISGGVSFRLSKAWGLLGSGTTDA